MSLGLDALIQHLGPAWAFRVLGLSMLATGLPAAWFIRERTSLRTGHFVEWFVANLTCEAFVEIPCSPLDL
jgi:anti-sigma factor RsiW